MTTPPIQIPAAEPVKKYERNQRDASIPVAFRPKQTKRPKEEGKGNLIDIFA